MLNINQVNNWQEKGFILVSNLLDNKKLDNVQEFLKEIYTKGYLKIEDFGSNGKLDFPNMSILDYITLDEKIINCVRQLLKTDDILLSQCDTWGKKGTDDKSNLSNNDQRMHMDYGNNTFLHPSSWDSPEAVAMIIYFSDVNETGGGTAVVPKLGNNDELYNLPYVNMPGIGNFEFINDKSGSEKYFCENYNDVYEFRKKLYDREIITKPKLGDILFYRLDIWHRGTPVKRDKVRFVMNLLWKKKECYWINQWNPGWTKKMYYGEIEKLFINLSPLQRSVLGVPLPDDPYWTKEKIFFLQKRYPGLDIKPYLKNSKL